MGVRLITQADQQLFDIEQTAFALWVKMGSSHSDADDSVRNVAAMYLPESTMKLQSSNRAVLRNVTLAAVLVTGLISLPVLAADASTTADNAVKKTERVASDSWITTKVKGEILSNSISKAFKVSVKTLHGDVTLRGALPNQDAVDLVKELAEKVKGVKSVDISQLTVVPA